MRNDDRETYLLSGRATPTPRRFAARKPNLTSRHVTLPAAPQTIGEPEGDPLAELLGLPRYIGPTKMLYDQYSVDGRFTIQSFQRLAVDLGLTDSRIGALSIRLRVWQRHTARVQQRHSLRVG